jgi:hypothetical protein
MKFINANKLHRKSGGVGHPSFAVRRDFEGGLCLPCVETRRISLVPTDTPVCWSGETSRSCLYVPTKHLR